MSERYKLARGVSLTQIDGKSVLFALKTGDTYGLNASAGTFVEALVKSDFDGAVRACASAYDAPEAEIAADMRELVRDLTGRGLLAPG